MRNSKLSIEKFRIAKLNNPKAIFGGGDGDDDGTIVVNPTKDKCKDMSDKPHQ